MMRQHPLLLVLDEPTAALDATAEHALFERYAAAADLVVVLHAGRVSEVGTHSELVAANGRYAELYNVQARGYRLLAD